MSMRGGWAMARRRAATATAFAGAAIALMAVGIGLGGLHSGWAGPLAGLGLAGILAFALHRSRSRHHFRNE